MLQYWHFFFRPLANSLSLHLATRNTTCIILLFVETGNSPDGLLIKGPYSDDLSILVYKLGLNWNPNSVIKQLTTLGVNVTDLIKNNNIK